ncbi:MAG: adenylate kinase [Candidatus Anstonellales archaeon]
MIIVMGLPGSGKSTVLSYIKNASYKRINYGDLMLDLAKKKMNITSRDELRRLPSKKQKELQALAADYLSKEKSPVLLDTHCSISTPNGYLPGLPFSVLSKLRVDHLVLIRAPPEQIIKRRQKDNTRKRDPDEKEKLEEHEKINIALLAAYSALSGAPAKIINNLDGEAEKAAKEIESIM